MTMSALTTCRGPEHIPGWPRATSQGANFRTRCEHVAVSLLGYCAIHQEVSDTMELVRLQCSEPGVWNAWFRGTTIEVERLNRRWEMWVSRPSAQDPVPYLWAAYRTLDDARGGLRRWIATTMGV